MICADSSSMVAFWQGDQGHDIQVIRQAVADRTLVLSPVSLTEILSYPSVPSPVESLVLKIPLLDILPGYWERAGRLRSHILSRRRKANIADTLIVQSCLDHRVPLIARDRDFFVFAQFAALLLL